MKDITTYYSLVISPPYNITAYFNCNNICKLYSTTVFGKSQKYLHDKAHVLHSNLKRENLLDVHKRKLYLVVIEPFCNLCKEFEVNG